MIKKIVESAKGLALPTQAKERRVWGIVRSVLDLVNNCLRKSKIDARLILGGSVAKGTWLKGLSDLDFFMLFDYKKYKKQSGQLADLTEKVLKKCFKKVRRLHGSRDYFSVRKGKFDLEIVPVLAIKRAAQAQNITDVSPLHIQFVKLAVAQNKALAEEIRLSKLFFKAQEVYGAESYIRGFSGHVVEILIAYYGSFLKLISAATKWKRGQVIDIRNYYKNKEAIFKKINQDKLTSPLIVIDPVQPERNAAAVLSMQKFDKLKLSADEFLRKPSLSFFVQKTISLKELKAEKRGRKLAVLQAKPSRGKQDIMGARLLKKFNCLKKKIILNDFKIQESGWQWPGKGTALFWIYLDKRELPKVKRHWGPPIKAAKKHVQGFSARWKSKVKIHKGRYFVELKRRFTKVDEFLRNLIKTDRELKRFKIIFIG